MSLSNLRKHPLLLISIGYLIVSCILLYFFNGTGGEADSINHYLYAKYAPQYPELYLNHWAKPIFTILVSPFAQMGFMGAKVFNVLIGLLTVVFTFKIAQQLQLKNAVLAPLFYFIFPLSFLVNFSGFTEPMFALMLCLSIYYCLKNNFLVAAILVSFSPFVRSEGLLFIGLFGLYFIYKKEYRVLLYLGLGHVMFSIIGFIFGESPLWVATKIPYASLQSHYGSGQIFHFSEQLIYMTGVPLLIFFLLGIIRSAFQKKWPINTQKSAFNFLILGGFLLFFIAHTLFWYLGIFNSMGLKRVFGAITPLMAILCLIGFNTLELIRLKWLRIGVKVLGLVYILVFPFTSNPAAVDWKKEMNLSEAQQAAEQVAQYINSVDSLKSQRFIYTDPYLGEALGIDPFDPEKRLILSPVVFPELKKGNVIIWDNWHAVVDYGVELEFLEQQQKLVKLKQFDDFKVKYVVFLNGKIKEIKD